MVVDLVDGVLEDLPCPLRVLGVELHTVLERLDLEVALPRRAAAAHRRQRLGFGGGAGGRGRKRGGHCTQGERRRGRKPMGENQTAPLAPSFSLSSFLPFYQFLTFFFLFLDELMTHASLPPCQVNYRKPIGPHYRIALRHSRGLAAIASWASPQRCPFASPRDCNLFFFFF